MHQVTLDGRHIAGLEVRRFGTGQRADPGRNVGRSCSSGLHLSPPAPLPPQGQVRTESAAGVVGPSAHGDIEQRLVDAYAGADQRAHVSHKVTWFDSALDQGAFGNGGGRVFRHGCDDSRACLCMEW